MMVGIAAAYSLSAYMVCFIQHVMWFDAIALLPIVIMYTEKMLKRTNLIDIRFVIVLAFTHSGQFLWNIKIKKLKSYIPSKS